VTDDGPRNKGANPREQRVLYRKCPVCEAFMRRSNYRKTSGVIIDICNEHGTWLDVDELEAIAGYVISGGRPEADEFLKELERNDNIDSRVGRRAAVRANVSMSTREIKMSSHDEPNLAVDVVTGALKLFSYLLR
jgi:Zn-finger nucleic acid-binding protein